MDLLITHADGSIKTICSGKSWETALSPIVFNSIYIGELYDARRELPHWAEPAFADSAWRPVIYTPAPSQNIVAQAMVPINRRARLEAASVHRFNDTDYIFDLGRNIAGVSGITLQGEPGTMIRLKHGELLYHNGHVDQSGIDVHYRPTIPLPISNILFCVYGKIVSNIHLFNCVVSLRCCSVINPT